MSDAPSFALVLAGHGSRDPDGVREFEELVRLMTARSAVPISHGYLEFAQPTVETAVERAIANGHSTIVVVPALLCAATHAKNDMPSELLQLRQRFPQTDIHFGAAMDLHPALLSLCRERIIAAEASSPHLVRRDDTCLVVVGRGTTDPDANSDISKLTRMLQEGMGFGASFVCYAGTASPLVAQGLRSAAKLGKRRIIVLPYLLFDGVLVKRIYAAARSLAARLREVEVIEAGYLGVAPQVVEVFLERALEGLEGRAHMNCSLCKYRVQIIGFERQVGAPQKSGHLRPSDDAGNGKKQPSGTADSSTAKTLSPYRPHPIEAQSYAIIRSGRDWSTVPQEVLPVAMRLVHTSGDLSAPDDLFVSPGAVDVGMRALLRCKRVVTDVTMVDSGIRKDLRQLLSIQTWCGVHDEETRSLAQSFAITRSAAGIRRAWQMFGNDVIVAIGDAPTAVAETVRLIQEQYWRPQLVVGLPVGFVGTVECKQLLRDCLQVPRITNSGSHGGSPWAASVINALMIEAINFLAAMNEVSTQKEGCYVQAGTL